MMMTIDFMNACKYYNECVLRNDGSSMDALDDLLATVIRYERETGNNIQFAGNKRITDATGFHPIKRVDIIGTMARAHIQF